MITGNFIEGLVDLLAWSEAKPEERKTFFGGGYEQKSLEPAALVTIYQGVLAFLLPGTA